jgi:sorbitol-specific phosphotransferase system component IIA
MTVIYQTTITRIGASATMALETDADYLSRRRAGGH